MKKRILSLLLVFVMVLGMLPTVAFAEEPNVSVAGEEEAGSDSVTVTLSLSRDAEYMVGAETGEVMAFKEITVPYFDLALYGLEEYYFVSESYGDDGDGAPGSDLTPGTAEYAEGKVTLLHLYLYALERFYCGVEQEDVGKGYLYDEGLIGTEAFTISGGVGSSFLNQFWGGDCNLNYYVNYQYPLASDGWGATADQILLKDGDMVTLGNFTSWEFYSDPYSIFNYIRVGDDVVNTTVTQGEKVTLSVYVAGPNMGTSYDTAQTPVMDVTPSETPVVYYTSVDDVSADVTEWTRIGEVDDSGEIVLDTSDLEPGEYLVCVPGQPGAMFGEICSTPGGIVLTVEAPECAHETWNAATCTTPKTCAACGATEGEADPDAHSYVDGACEYCGEADPDAAPVIPFTATADGEAVEIVDLDTSEECEMSSAAHKLSVTVPAGTDSLTITGTAPTGGGMFVFDSAHYNMLNNPLTVNMDDDPTYFCFIATTNDSMEAYHICIEEAPCEHSFVDGTCEYCGKPEIEPTDIIKAGTGWSSIDWPYAGCNINRVTVNNVKVDSFTQNGTNYYITLDSAVADDAAVELGIGTNLQYSNLWVLVDDQCITESPISASTDLTHTVQLVDGTATVKIGGCPGYNTGSYIQSYAVNKTFHFSNSGQFPVAPMLAGGSSTAALRVQNETWSADLSALFKNISDKEVTYKVAIDGAETVECDADYTYTCDAPGTHKLVFTAVNDYGTSPSYTATISVLPSEAVKEANYAVQGGTITWFAFTDDQLNALPEGTTYEWDAETTTWTIIQPADINVTGKVITYYNLVKDDPSAKLPLLSGSNQIAGAGTMWDGAVRNQQTNTLSNGAVSTYVYLFEKKPTSTSADQYTLIRFNYDRQKPDTYFEYKVDGNAELTIVGDVGGVNGHQWTGDREVHVALNGTTPADALISCVEKSNSVTLSDGAGQFSYKTGPWYDEKTWYVKYKIDQFPTLVDSETSAVDVTIPALETYTLDLSTIFADPDESDTLTYQVKLNDGSWTNIEGNAYSYTPESAQEYVLTFRAYDSFVYAEDTYTVNMTATNATETYTVTVTAPENVQFYCTAEFAEGVDVLGVPVQSEYAEGVYTLSVPANVSRISWRMGEVGMSAAVEADSVLTLIEANFKIMAGEAEDTGALTVKYGDYVAVGSENSYLLLDDAEYSYAVTPADTLYRAYNESEKIPVAGENVIELTLKHITVIAPEGSTVSSGRFYSYFRYDFNEAQKTTTLDDGCISVDFPVPGSESFIRVHHPDGVTYWDFEKNGFSDGTTLEVTADMLFIGSDEYTKDTVYANFEKNNKDKADLYLTVNAQGWLDMDSGDVHSLNVFRNWIPVANSISNNGVSLPDVTYTVVDINGNASDVVEVFPDANNSCYADIKAVKAGTAIILVSYDAVYNADGEGGKQFSAIWPENTGVIVVTVDAEDANIQTNITVNEEANAGGKQILDVEHDILFYVGTSGAEYSFKPEDGCTVTVARSTVAEEMTFNGFTNQGVTVAEDGTVTISGLTTGTHIIKVEKDGKAAYQGIRAREVEYKLTHSDGSEVTAENPAQPGETVTVQFSRLVDPLAKLSGVYNANFGFYYNGEDGAAIRTSGGTYGVYNFSSNKNLQKFTVTVPAEWNGASYTLTDGGIKLGGFGGSFGSHRSTTYIEGKEVNMNASGTAGVASVLPDVVIPTVCSHDWTDATCTAPKTCSKCGETEGNALGHTEEIIPGKAATCTETGLTEGKKCTVCGEITVEQTVIDALGHTEETVPGKAATCTEPGLTEGVKCTVCDATITAQETIPATGHTEETVTGYAATCNEPGLTDGVKCSVCDATITAQEVIEALGHTPAEAVRENVVDATCQEAGSYEEVVYCAVCDTEISRETKALNKIAHTLDPVAAKAPTLEAEGNIAHWKCSACGALFMDEAGTEETTLEEVAIPKLTQDQAAANEVIQQVAKLPTLNQIKLSDKSAVIDAYNAYQALTDEQKDLVPEATVKALEAAVERIEKLEKEENDKPVIIVPSRPSKPVVKPVAPKMTFTDVSKNDWFYNSVKEACENGLIDGMSATEFDPNGKLTIAQAIKLAAALHQLEKNGKVTLKNGDDVWYSTYVAYAINNGIIDKAYGELSYAQMNAAATRSEFVAIFHGAKDFYAEKNTVADNAIPDVKMTDKNAAEIYEFYRAGILTGNDEAGTFAPNSSIKRSEVAAILIRMFDLSARQSVSLK